MQKEFSKIKLTSREIDYSQWYLDVAKSWELFEYSPVQWCITFLPKSVTIWEKIKYEINKKISLKWVQNLYLPMLIPMSFFEKEKEHVDGFAPELAIVTIWWGKELEDKLAIRPTSETLFCDFFKWQLQSYRDLPLLYNQWVNVLRWEKRTRPFLRTAEFYWQEWHTLHETKEEARDFALWILNDVYVKVINDVMAISWIKWKKTESEKFAWAETTFTYEPMMSNGWALQICTSHVLGKWFMEQFWVSFLNRDGIQDYPSYTSWWLSTRSIWWIISSHSDDKGLIIPPKLSEYKAVILPLYWSEQPEKVINLYVKNIAENIVWWWEIVPIKWENFKAYVWYNWEKVLIDYRNVRLGEKLTDFELSWYPISIVVWARDITDPWICKNGKCEIRSRITWEKEIIDINPIILNEKIDLLLNQWQKILKEKSKERLENNIVQCNSFEEIWIAVEEWKFALYEWDKNPKLEADIKEKFKATTRCIPDEWQFSVIDKFELKNQNNVKVIIARSF
jgi:prolyl-tRNA synthetase